MRVLVTGSRMWKHPATVKTALDSLWNAMQNHPDGPDPDPLTVVHGDCRRGADKFAKQWAQQAAADGLNVVEEPYPADWGLYGKSAGFKRNAEMVEAGADVCVAFFTPVSRGTWHCSTLAAKAGIPLVKYTEGA